MTIAAEPSSSSRRSRRPIACRRRSTPSARRSPTLGCWWPTTRPPTAPRRPAAPAGRRSSPRRGTSARAGRPRSRPRPCCRSPRGRSRRCSCSATATSATRPGSSRRSPPWCPRATPISPSAPSPAALDLAHRDSGRTLRGFAHRGRQLADFPACTCRAAEASDRWSDPRGAGFDRRSVGGPRGGGHSAPCDRWTAPATSPRLLLRRTRKPADRRAAALRPGRRGPVLHSDRPGPRGDRSPGRDSRGERIRVPAGRLLSQRHAASG